MILAFFVAGFIRFCAEGILTLRNVAVESRSAAAVLLLAIDRGRILRPWKRRPHLVRQAKMLMANQSSIVVPGQLMNRARAATLRAPARTGPPDLPSILTNRPSQPNRTRARSAG
jgi:hypothetical protein